MMLRGRWLCSVRAVQRAPSHSLQARNTPQAGIVPSWVRRVTPGCGSGSGSDRHLDDGIGVALCGRTALAREGRQRDRSIHEPPVTGSRSCESPSDTGWLSSTCDWNSSAVAVSRLIPAERPIRTADQSFWRSRRNRRRSEGRPALAPPRPQPQGDREPFFPGAVALREGAGRDAHE
jgi:hypothetical protein